jgi:hypothetical protein
VAGARTWILDQFDAERSRWMLWLPVGTYVMRWTKGFME